MRVSYTAAALCARKSRGRAHQGARKGTPVRGRCCCGAGKGPETAVKSELRMAQTQALSTMGDWIVRFRRERKGR